MGVRLLGEASRELDLALTAVAIGALLFDGWLLGAAVWSSRTAAAQAREVAQRIAGGHAFEKHVVRGGEFPAITTREAFAAQVTKIIRERADVKALKDGRTAYWDGASGTVVIVNPSASDGGTAFKPAAGKAYFDQLRRRGDP